MIGTEAEPFNLRIAPKPARYSNLVSQWSWWRLYSIKFVNVCVNSVILVTVPELQLIIWSAEIVASQSLQSILKLEPLNVHESHAALKSLFKRFHSYRTFECAHNTTPHCSSCLFHTSWNRRNALTVRNPTCTLYCVHEYRYKGLYCL